MASELIIQLQNRDGSFNCEKFDHLPSPKSAYIAICYANNLQSEQFAKDLKSKLINILDQIGMKHSHSKDTVYAGFKLGVSGVSHQSGTCKFGVDPSTSVLDLNCKMHDLDNVYVVDTSFFPSSGAVNPALTAMANALRIGAHLSSN